MCRLRTGSRHLNIMKPPYVAVEIPRMALHSPDEVAIEVTSMWGATQSGVLSWAPPEQAHFTAFSFWARYKPISPPTHIKPGPLPSFPPPSALNLNPITDTYSSTLQHHKYTYTLSFLPAVHLRGQTEEYDVQFPNCHHGQTTTRTSRQNCRTPS